MSCDRVPALVYQPSCVNSALLLTCRCRHTCATGLGHDCFADFSQQGLLIGSPTRVAEFLQLLAEAVRPFADQQAQRVIRAHESGGKQLQAWDWEYAKVGGCCHAAVIGHRLAC